ncbi:MAG TPA: vitamin K epoxide reductase family protein, partial [Pedococcus sp.]
MTGGVRGSRGATRRRSIEVVGAGGRPADVLRVVRAGAAGRRLRRWYAALAAAGALGTVAAAWQTVERIAWAASGSEGVAGSVCEVNSVLSCSSVYSHWQSSALGLPNSVVALPVFALIATAGLAGALGSVLDRRFVRAVATVTVGMAAFIAWYLVQTGLVIGVLCLFCVGCGVAILVAGAAVTRVTVLSGAVRPAGSGGHAGSRVARALAAVVASGADLVVWAGVAGVLTLVLVLGL